MTDERAAYKPRAADHFGEGSPETLESGGAITRATRRLCVISNPQNCRGQAFLRRGEEYGSRLRNRDNDATQVRPWTARGGWPVFRCTPAMRRSLHAGPEGRWPRTNAGKHLRICGWREATTKPETIATGGGAANPRTWDRGAAGMIVLDVRGGTSASRQRHRLQWSLHPDETRRLPRVAGRTPPRPRTPGSIIERRDCRAAGK